MTKKWDEMTQEEKIEALRTDVTTIFKHLNELSSRQRELGQRLEQVVNLAREIGRKVDAQAWH